MRTLILIALATLVVKPALPDIIGVTVNGTAGGSGNVTLPCFSVQLPDCPSAPSFIDFPFTFSGTNTQLGMFSASGSTFASSPNSPGFVNASAESDQTTEANAQSFSVVLRDEAISSGVGAAEFFKTGFFNNESLTFTLTTESFLRLTGDQDELNYALPFGSLGLLLDSHGNVLFAIPQGAFFFDNSLILAPGTYQWVESDFSMLFEGPYGFGQSLDISSGINVSAQFTPIPEPRWAWVVPLLSIVLGYCLLQRRGGIAEES
jgi:hypothetical protein